MYTDGASRGNPGPGGYGTILMWKGNTRELSAGYRHTTNNRMELMAVIAGLEVNSVDKGWLKNWIATDFRGGKKNRDLWQRYHELSKKHHIQFHWVKGHASNPHNNRCDELATQAADGSHLLDDDGYEG